MELFESIKERYSYRDGYLDKGIDRKDLEKIVSAGMAAPSGKNAQTTEFVIVDDDRLLSSIGELHVIQAMKTMKALIVCIVDSDPEPVHEDLSFQVEDCSAAVENMLLAITALGYASVWIDGWLRREGRADKIASLLGIPGSKKVRVILPLGVPEKPGPRRKKKPFGERAWFNKYKA